MGAMDLKERKSFREQEMREKCCVDCKTTKTPLWRGGPAGPKSLCNACGIRYRKKRRAAMSLNTNRPEKKRERSQSHSNTATTTSKITGGSASDASNIVESDTAPNGKELNKSLKLRLMVLGNEVLLQRSSPSPPPPPPPPPPVVKKQRCHRRRKLREEEQAAFSLMAMSCGSIFA